MTLVLTMDDPGLPVKLARRLRARQPQLTIVARARARDSNQAATLYRAGVTDAVPETLENSLQLSEAVLIDDTIRSKQFCGFEGSILLGELRGMA